MNDKAHFLSCQQKLSAANLATIKLVRQLEITDPVKLRTLFLSLVASQMYGIVFADLDAIRMLEVTARKFVKFLFMLPLSTSNAFCDAIFHFKPVIFSVMKARLNFLSRILNAAEFSPTFDLMQASLLYLFPKNFGWFTQFAPLCEHVGIDFTLDWLNDVDFAVSQFRDAAILNRCSYFDQYSSMRLCKLIFVDNSFPDDFLRLLFELQVDKRRRVMLMLAGVGRATLLAGPVPQCPFCNAVFNSDHFLSCPVFWLNDTVEQFFVRCAKARQWKVILDKLEEIDDSWSAIAGFMR